MNINRYKLELRCTNCGRRFNEEFERGFEVKERGAFEAHKTILNERKELVECPFCGCNNVRKVIFD